MIVGNVTIGFGVNSFGPVWMLRFLLLSITVSHNFFVLFFILKVESLFELFLSHVIRISTNALITFDPFTFFSFSPLLPTTVNII